MEAAFERFAEIYKSYFWEFMEGNGDVKRAWPNEVSGMTRLYGFSIFADDFSSFWLAETRHELFFT